MSIILSKPVEKTDIIKLGFMTGREHCYISTSIDEPAKDDN